MDDLLNDSSNVSFSLGVVEVSVLGGSNSVVLVGSVNSLLSTLSLGSDNSSH